MSAQLTLDAIGGIDWEHPRLEQVEQFLDSEFPGICTEHARRRSMECLRVCGAGGWEAYVNVELCRMYESILCWYVFVELVPPEDSGLDWELHRLSDGDEPELVRLIAHAIGAGAWNRDKEEA